MSMNKPGRVIEIDVSIQSNTLIVGINGGNVTAAPGDRVIWRAGAGVKAFTLQFYRLAAEPAADHGGRGHVVVADLPRWPFEGEPPPNDTVGPTERFQGVLLGEASPASAFKYSVAVGNLQLDPIVIIDR